MKKPDYSMDRERMKLAEEQICNITELSALKRIQALVGMRIKSVAGYVNSAKKAKKK